MILINHKSAGFDSHGHGDLTHIRIPQRRLGQIGKSQIDQIHKPGVVPLHKKLIGNLGPDRQPP